MTPTDFELLTQRLLTDKLKENFGRDILVDHKRKFASLTGNTYEIDVSYSYSTFGIDYLNLGECKYWDSYVTREKVGYFKAILDDLKAHKGIVFTTKGFQSGAITFAKTHGIGLIKITNDNYFEVHAHFDGGLNKIEEILNADEVLSDKASRYDVGIFYPQTNPYDFIRIHYGADLANYLENEYSPDILDDITYDINPRVRQQIMELPDSWYEQYYISETGGLCYKLQNEPELRILNKTLHLLKLGIMSNR
jgi:hypothetical protein